MVVMFAMKDRLRPSRFLFSLKKIFSSKYVEILSQAKKHANFEKAIVARKETSSDRVERKNKRRREEPFDRGRSIQPKCS